jgi:hypothetical protein
MPHGRAAAGHDRAAGCADSAIYAGTGAGGDAGSLPGAAP